MKFSYVIIALGGDDLTAPANQELLKKIELSIKHFF